MKLGKVIGSVYSTILHPFYQDKRLLLVRLYQDKTNLSDNYIIALDSVGAGSGENVLIIDEGNSARQIVEDAKAPLRSIIVGIVDDIN
ncbi:MAG: ethanolamine utilization microcompartment protein EutN [Calditrichia bacterium]